MSYVKKYFRIQDSRGIETNSYKTNLHDTEICVWLLKVHVEYYLLLTLCLTCKILNMNDQNSHTVCRVSYIRELSISSV